MEARDRNKLDRTPAEYVALAATWDKCCDHIKADLDVHGCKQIHTIIQQQSAEIEELRQRIADGDYACLRELELIREASGHGNKPMLSELAGLVAKDYAELARWRSGWQPIETAPKGRDVLVFYRNELGKSRISRACYFRPNVPYDDDPYEGCVENGEGSGEWLAPAAWYETSWADDESRCYAIEETITHWMPLPPEPGETRVDPRDSELAALREVVGMFCAARNSYKVPPPKSATTWDFGKLKAAYEAVATAALESEADHA